MPSAPGSIVYQLKRNRQAFAFGIESIHTLYNAGLDAGDPLKTLRAKIEDDPVPTALYLPRAKMNQQLEQATENLLAAQLVVAVGDIIKNRSSFEWVSSDVPEIQFLRQIRNGAAHDNRLDFRRDEDPVDPTRWNCFEITEGMEDKVIFTEMEYPMVYSEGGELIEGFFEAGDAFSLVDDIIRMVEEDVGIPDDEVPDDKLHEWILEAVISMEPVSFETISTILDLRVRNIPDQRLRSELGELEQQGRIERIDGDGEERYRVLPQ